MDGSSAECSVEDKPVDCMPNVTRVSVEDLSHGECKKRIVMMRRMVIIFFPGICLHGSGPATLSLGRALSMPA